jgi:hypothetical protein
MAFWDSTVFATIVGGLIALVTAIVLLIIQNWLKQAKDKKVSQDSDIRKVLGIKDYLAELQKSLEISKDSLCPCYVILPFLNQVEFAEYNDVRLKDIRELYNLLSLKIHNMQVFYVRQCDDPEKLGQVGREVVSQGHRRLRNEVLDKMKILIPKIESFLEEQRQWGNSCPFRGLCDWL